MAFDGWRPVSLKVYKLARELRNEDMSSNDPYGADGGGYGQGQSQVSEWEEPRKTSIAAVLALISSLIICVPILTQLLGILFGVIGVVSVSRSGGRRKGTGLAIAGIVISVVVMAGFAFAGLSLKTLFEKLGSEPDAMMTALYTDDFTTVRNSFAANVGESMSDADFMALRTKLESEYGTYQKSELHWSFSTFEKLGQTTGQTQFNNAIPAPTLFTFDGKKVAALVIYQAPTGNTGSNAPEFLVQQIFFVSPDGSLWDFPASGDFAQDPPNAIETDPAVDTGADSADEDATEDEDG